MNLLLHQTVPCRTSQHYNNKSLIYTINYYTTHFGTRTVYLYIIVLSSILLQNPIHKNHIWKECPKNNLSVLYVVSI